MKTVIGSIAAAVAASACCLGPVLVGAGALGAASVRLEPLRPAFLACTGVLVLAGFYVTYRWPSEAACGRGGACTPASNRRARVLLWAATIIVILLVTFPYYVNWLV